MFNFYIWMDNDENDNTQKIATILQIAFSYAEDIEEFSFYIRSVVNIHDLPTLIPKKSRAVFHFAKGISRKYSVMGWNRHISMKEIESRSPSVHRTLNVDRSDTTLFNEYFTCQAMRKDFKNTLLRIQICEVDQNDRNIVVMEMDYWLDDDLKADFTQFELPFQPYLPDLGEVELNMVYLPTVERIVIHYSSVTNLKLDEECQGIYIRGSVFVNNKVLEIHKTDTKETNYVAATTDDGLYFTKKLIFDVSREEFRFKAQLLIHVVQLVDGAKHVIGGILLSAEKSDHWRQMLVSPRKSISHVHRLVPTAG